MFQDVALSAVRLFRVAHRVVNDKIRTYIIPVRAVSSGSEPRENITLRAYVRTYARRNVRTYVRRQMRTYVRTYVRRDPDPLSSPFPPTYVRTYVSILCMCCEGFTLELQKRQRERGRERAYVRTYRTYVRTYAGGALPGHPLPRPFRPRACLCPAPPQSAALWAPVGRGARAHARCARLANRRCHP